METEIKEQDCIYESNFQEAQKKQMSIEEYLRSNGLPININEEEVQQLLDNIILEDSTEEESY